MTKLARNTTYLTAALVGQKVIAFFYFAVIARLVGVEWTGKYFLALSIVIMVGALADFGLTPVLVREVAKRPDEQQRLLSSVLGLKLVLAVLSIIVVVLVARLGGYDSMTANLMLAATVVMLLDTLHLTYYGIFRGRHALATESVGMFVGQGITCVVGIVSLIVQPNLFLLVAALIAGSAWNVALSAYRLWKVGMNPFIVRFERPHMLWLLKTAFPFALAAVFVKAYSTADTIILERTVGESAVGLYSVANKLTYAFQFLPMAFIAALYPTFSHLIQARDREGLLRVFDRSMWYVTLIAVPIVFGVFSVADLVVPLIYGGDYGASIVPLQILIFALLFIFLDFPIGSLLNADDRQVTKTIIMGQTMVINLIANLILIPRFGVEGASAATMVSFVWLLGASLVAAQKTVPYGLARFLRTIGPILFSGILMAAVVLALKPWLGLTVIPVGGVVYVAALFLFRSLSWQDFTSFKREFQST